MAEATWTVGHQPSSLDSPNVEVANVTASDGETYTSRKFRNISAAFVQITDDVTSFSDEFVSVQLSATVSSQVIVQLAGSDTTDVECTLVLFGEP